MKTDTKNWAKMHLYRHGQGHGIFISDMLATLLKHVTCRKQISKPNRVYIRMLNSFVGQELENKYGGDMQFMSKEYGFDPAFMKWRQEQMTGRVRLDVHVCVYACTHTHTHIDACIPPRIERIERIDTV
jgi:hypothetical protein